MASTWRVQYRHAPDAPTVHTAEVSVEDPAIGHLHRAVRESDPARFAGMQDPAELVIVRAEPA